MGSMAVTVCSGAEEVHGKRGRVGGALASSEARNEQNSNIFQIKLKNTWLFAAVFVSFSLYFYFFLSFLFVSQKRFLHLTSNRSKAAAAKANADADSDAFYAF